MAELGRIWFLDNPWPNGHGIAEMVWTGLLQKQGVLLFEFTLESNEYDEDAVGMEPKEKAVDWHHPSVWKNYHKCRISLNGCGDNTHGFQAGTKAAPFIPQVGETIQFHVDPLSDAPPMNIEYRTFGIYLLGHDGVLDHRISLKRLDQEGNYYLQWSGKIALEYVGEETFDYSFTAEIPSIRLSKIRLEEGIEEAEAKQLLEKLYDGSSPMTLEKYKNSLVFMAN